MDAFDYTAVARDGARTKGTLSAPSLRDARDMLRVRDLTPVALKASKAKADDGAGSRGRIRHSHRVLSTRQLAILVGADQPVEAALKLVALQFPDSAIRSALLDVRTQVMEGARLSRAMRAHPRAFPELYTAMVAAGEQTDTLAPVLDRLAMDLEAAQVVRRRIMAATAYPVVLLVVAVLVVSLMMTVIVPKVVEQFDTFGAELPALTRGVMAASAFLTSWWWAVLAALVLGALALWRATKVPAVAMRLARARLRLPVLGGIIRNLNTARFSRTLASLIASGTPQLGALETASHTLTNIHMRDAARAAAVRVREGASMSRALARSDVFPPMVVQMVAGGEASDNVGAMFDKSADYLESEFEAASSVFLALLEPAIIILLAVVVLLVVGAIFMPILQLNTLI